MDDAPVREYKNLWVPRVSHFDAQSLDLEIFSLLKKTLLDAVKYVGVGLYTKLEPEIDVVIKLFIYRWTLVRNRATVGQRLLQMKYDRGVPKQVLGKYCLFLVFVPWIRKRYNDLCSIIFKDEIHVDTCHKIFNYFEVVYSACHLINLFVFLHEGYYSSLAERMFKLRPVPTILPHQRQISYTFFSRELLWHGIAEFLAFVLPLVPTKSVHNFIRRCLPNSNSIDLSGAASLSEDDASLTSSAKCMVCGESPVIPFQYGCRHVACYYCLFSKYAEDRENFRCSFCGYKMESAAQMAPVVV